VINFTGSERERRGMASSPPQEEKYTVALKYEMFSFSEEVIKSINF